MGSCLKRQIGQRSPLKRAWMGFVFFLTWALAKSGHTGRPKSQSRNLSKKPVYDYINVFFASPIYPAVRSMEEESDKEERSKGRTLINKTEENEQRVTRESDENESVMAMDWCDTGGDRECIEQRDKKKNRGGGQILT